MTNDTMGTSRAYNLPDTIRNSIHHLRLVLYRSSFMNNIEICLKIDKRSKGLKYLYLRRPKQPVRREHSIPSEKTLPVRKILG